MTDARVARRYANALFNAALKLGVVDSVSSDLEAIVGALRANPDFSTFLRNPERTRAEKLGLIDKVFGDRITTLTMQALRLILDKRREDLIEVIELEFMELRRQHENVTHVVVRSASELPQDLKDAIVKRVVDSSGKRVEAAFEVDPALIGGVRILYDDDIVVDASLRGGLVRLRERVMIDLLKQH